MGKTKPSALDRAGVSPRPRHPSSSKNPLAQASARQGGPRAWPEAGGRVGPPCDCRHRRESQSQWEESQGSGALAYFRVLGPPSPGLRCGASLLLSGGGTRNLPAFGCSRGVGKGGCSLAQRPQARPPTLEHHGQVPPCLKVAEAQLWGVGVVPFNALKELPEMEPSRTLMQAEGEGSWAGCLTSGVGV